MSYLLKKGGLCQGGFCLFPNCHTLSLHRQYRDNILCKQPQKIDYRKGGGGGGGGVIGSRYVIWSQFDISRALQLKQVL